MPLSVGARLGPYEVIGALGAGGMGEVYRARDMRLDRSVAIKVLSSEIANDPDLRARFEREARAIAALDHPHICGIYDVGAADGTHYFVMPHLEGETLAARLEKGALPLDQALKIAGEIADALDKAHRKGITHRDLKPANIMLTKTGAKLLDFGLAKLKAPAGPVSMSAMAKLATASPATAHGMILGTVQYMAPEQVEGQEADTRSDIWALGAVLYEMVTGTRPFQGESPASVMGSILKDDPPPISARQPLVPHALTLLVDRCLAKDPDERWQSIGDVRYQLTSIDVASERGVVGAGATRHRARTSLWLIGAGAIVLSGLVALVTRSLVQPRAEPAARSSVRIAVGLGRDAVLEPAPVPTFALSPDGERIVFVSTGPDGVNHLSTRRLDQPEPTLLPGTEGAFSPFFAPDGQWVGFFAGGKLKKTRLDGGAPQILCDAPAGRGASWGEDGRIVAALDTRTGLSLVTADGGVVTRATELGPGELTHRLPQILQGGKAVLFSVSATPGAWGDASVAVASLGTSPAKARIVLPNVGMFPRYLPSGHLVYVANSRLYAVPFDENRLEVRGPATAVLEDVASSVTLGVAQIDFSPHGHLLYLSGRTSGQTTVQWLTADGRNEPLLAEPGFYQFCYLAPDGIRLLTTRADGANIHVWVYDPQRGGWQRLTAGTGVNTYPIWSTDGQAVVFSSNGQLHWVRADGSEQPQPLIKTAGLATPASFTPDGKRLMFVELKTDGGSRLQTMTIASESGRVKAGEPELFRELSASQPFAAISPDGRWVAYASSDSGAYEVFVRAFPDTGRQWPVSTGGGNSPVWSRTSHELFYRTQDQVLMVVKYSVVGESFMADKPRVWSSKRLFNTGLTRNFDLAPDGKRFAVLMSAESAEPRATDNQATLVLDFFDEIRRRVVATAGPPGH